MYPDFKELLSVLNEHRVKYLIVSAYAVGVHAQPRATKDLDILVTADPKSAEAVFAALAKFGAPLEGLTVADFSKPGPFLRIGRALIGVEVLTKIPGLKLLGWSFTTRFLQTWGSIGTMFGVLNLIRAILADGVRLRELSGRRL